jgi:hypothetical protein
MKRFLAWAVLSYLVVAAASADGQRPVVVELYTSQGCGTCVSADKLLDKLADRRDILAMSLPVTYWDMLGWKDTLATEANTWRQKAYAKAMGRGAVYTPQMIVDGAIDVVGSRVDEVKKALDAETAAAKACRNVRSQSHQDGCPCSVAVGVTARRSDRLRIAIPAATEGCRKAKPDATVWVFFLRDSAKVKVEGGENKGQVLKYRNLVVGITSAGAWRGDPVSFTVPAATKFIEPGGVAVVVQQGGYGRVLGAAYLPGLEYYAKQ